MNDDTRKWTDIKGMIWVDRDPCSDTRAGRRVRQSKP
jgi:hypothetical protein